MRQKTSSNSPEMTSGALRSRVDRVLLTVDIGVWTEFTGTEGDHQICHDAMAQLLFVGLPWYNYQYCTEQTHSMRTGKAGGGPGGWLMRLTPFEGP